MLNTHECGRAACNILTDDVDGVGHVTEDDRSLASHLARVVAAVTVLDVCTATNTSLSLNE